MRVAKPAAPTLSKLKLSQGQRQPRLNELFAQTDIFCLFCPLILFFLHFPQVVLHGFAAFAELMHAVTCGFDVGVVRLRGLDPLEAAGGLFFDLYLLEKKSVSERARRNGDERGQ